jgi:tetratricopeptide (TPR) repeat protein
MSPRMRPTLPPRFAEEMSDEDFEDLSRDLLAKEEGIRASERYGRSGQGQRGIDVLAYRKDSVELETGQCKRVATFTIKILEAAVAEFLAAWDHWESRNVRRFIIFVACPIRDTHVQEAIITQTGKLHALGLIFEVWDAARLVEKLRPWPDLVERYCGAAWVKPICGSVVQSGAGSAALQHVNSMAAGASLLTDCISEFRETCSRELIRIRELARSGQIRSAFEQMEMLRDSPRWPMLTDRNKALALRLAASLHLDHRGDLRTTKELLEKARTLEPAENYQVLDAVIHYRECGCAAALEMLMEPRDLDAWNVKLALLVEAHRSGEVLHEIERADFSPNGGTLRIASVAALLTGDFEKAKSLAAEALRLAPQWFQVRLHAAKMQYLGALLSHFPMRTHLDWPVPPDWEYVRRDAKALAAFRAAEEEFRQLVELTEQDDPERAKIEGWRLACLSNDPARRSEAEAYAQQLLRENPAHLPATVWSLQCGFAVDAQKLRAAFSTHANGNLTPDTAQALCTIHIQSDCYGDALAVLDRSKQMFESLGASFAWRFLRAQLAAELGSREEAAALVDEETDPAHRRDMRLAVLRVIARKTHDFAELADAAAKAYKEIGSPKYLFEACEASFEAGRPEFIAAHAEELLTHFPTSAALQLAVQGTFNAGKYASCLKLLREHRGFLPDAGMPVPMKRVEIECLRQIGELATAAEQAEALAREAHDTESLVSLFQTQVTLNDFRASAVTARQLLKRSDVTSLGLLQMARAIHVEDSALAAECWKEAVRRGVVDPAELLGAVDLAFRLGMEDAVAPLMPKFFALAQKPNSPVQAKALDEIRELMCEEAERRGDINKKYNECELPAHLAVPKLACTLATLYHEKPRGCREEGRPLRHFPVLARHGARLSIARPQITAGTLFADVTAIMLAAEVELIEVVEKAFAPILISAHLPESLRHQIDAAAPKQPALEKRRQTVVESVERKDIAVVQATEGPARLVERYSAELGDRWGALLGRAQTGQGLLCDFMPPLGLSGLPVKVSDEDRPFLVSCGDVVDALRRGGAISDAEAAAAVHRLGECAPSFNPEASISTGTLIVLDNGIAEQFAGAGVLDALATFARVEISEEDIATIRAERAAHAQSLATVSWLKALAERIHRGIQRNVYRTVTTTDTPREGVRAPDTSEEHCLFDMLAAEKLGATTVWCDDRFISRYERISGAQNYGVGEILRCLRAAGRVSEDAHFAALLRLRASNVRYLPVEADEMRYHILRAPLAAGAVKETPPLVTLRRYVAACCLDRARMRPPGQLNGRTILGEFQWVADSFRAISDTITKMWAEPAMKEEERRARAEWLLNEMLIPFHGVAEAQTALPQPQNGAEGVAGMLALLFACGFTLDSPWKRKQEDPSHARSRYWRWLGRRLVEPLFQLEPQIVSRVAAFEADGLLQSRKRRRKDQLQTRVLRGLAMRGWMDLPRVIQNQMKLNAEARRWLGLTSGRWIIGAFGREFDHDAFWGAIAEAWTRGSAAVPTLEGEEYTLSGFDAPVPPRRIPIRGPGLPENARLIEPRARVLCGDVAARRSYLESRIDWFDFGAERARKRIQEIVRIAHPGKRIRELEQVIEESSEEFYRSLFRRLRRHESVTAEQSLPPSAASFCDHLRLRDERFSEKKVCLDACASRLIREVGLAWAVERFASLPILLPASIWAELRGLGERELRQVFARLRRRLRSPLARLHLMHLLADRAAVLPAYLDEAKVLLASLLSEDEGREEWRTFHILLEWTRRSFQALHDFRKLDAPTRLVLTWLHAVRLHNTLLRVSVDRDLLRRSFENSAEALGIDISACDRRYWHDAAHPRYAGRLHVLLRGLGAMLKSLPTEAAAQLRLTKAPWNERMGASALMLLQNMSLGHNALGSFLGEESMTLLEGAFDEAVLKSILPLAPPQVLQQALTELEAAPENLSTWHLVSIVAGDKPLPEALRAKVDALVEKIDFAKLAIEHPDDESAIIHLISGRTLAGLPLQTLQKIEQQIWRLVDEFRGAPPEEERLHRRINLIASCFISLAVVDGDEGATFQRFYKHLTELAGRWPTAIPILRRRFHGWPTRQPLARQRGLWELELTLRALA